MTSNHLYDVESSCLRMQCIFLFVGFALFLSESYVIFLCQFSVPAIITNYHKFMVSQPTRTLFSPQMPESKISFTEPKSRCKAVLCSHWKLQETMFSSPLPLFWWLLTFLGLWLLHSNPCHLPLPCYHLLVYVCIKSLSLSYKNICNWIQNPPR